MTIDCSNTSIRKTESPELEDKMTNWAEEIDIEAATGISRRAVNGNLRPVSNDTCRALIGLPRGSFGRNCEEPENPAFIALLETRNFGPFRARGLRPAVQGLQAILDDIRLGQPDIHARLGTAGMLCCRLVRGSSSVISNHSWGTAIDLKIDGQLDVHGNGLAQRGLIEIWRTFNRHGWYWGAAFPTEDGMHFEASDQLIRKWAAEGAFGEPKAAPVVGLSFGSRGSAVEALQQALNRQLPTQIAVDGLFGKDTRSAVMAFQTLKGMRPTGIATAAVLRALGI
jgi:Putative peptidoglycan binding domain/D-alanyl-D-alanine carboxypeptidase